MAMRTDLTSHLIACIESRRLHSQLSDCKYLSGQLTKLLIHRLRACDENAVTYIFEYAAQHRVPLNPKYAAAAALPCSNPAQKGQPVSYVQAQQLLSFLHPTDRNFLWSLFSSPGDAASNGSPIPNCASAASSLGECTSSPRSPAAQQGTGAANHMPPEMAHAALLQMCGAVVNSGSFESSQFLPANTTGVSTDDLRHLEVMHKHNNFYMMQQLIGLGLQVSARIAAAVHCIARYHHRL